ncbi:MAG: hypothetical protein Q9N67_00540 [Ghiorsea sp.]|nr:hypothetical protein [Ghiorsea sp.]
MMRSTPFIFHDLQDSQVFSLVQKAGQQGYLVHGLVQNKQQAPWVNCSRYIQHYVESPSLGDINAGLYALNLRKHKLNGVFVPVVDDIAELLAEYAPLLRKNGLKFLTAKPEQIEQINTFYLQQWGGKLSIPPTAYCSGEDILSTAKNIGFPVLLKSYRDGFVAFDSEKDLQHWLKTVEGYPFHFVQRVQRYIQGNINTMATVMLLFDAQSRPVRGFTGRRLRVVPTQFGPFGETLAAQAEWIPDLYDATVELLSAIGWVGFAEVECKQDEHGVWHLLEINPRLSGWACLAEDDGAGLLSAYHQICTEDAKLEPSCLQHSTTHYQRVIASALHQPDWSCFNKRTYKTMLTYPKNQCFSAWDKEDKSANQAWSAYMLQRLKNKA